MTARMLVASAFRRKIRRALAFRLKAEATDP